MKVTITERLSYLEQIKLIKKDSFNESMYEKSSLFNKFINDDINDSGIYTNNLQEYLRIFTYLRVFSKKNGQTIENISKSLEDEHLMLELKKEANDLKLKYKELYLIEIDEEDAKKFEMEMDEFSYYNFEEDTIFTIKNLIEQLIGEINKSEELTERFKKDFIEKLNKIYKDIDNNVNEIGAFWSLMADAQYIYYSVVLNKTEILKKLTKIIKLGIRTQQTVQELNGESIINLLNEFED